MVISHSCLVYHLIELSAAVFPCALYPVAGMAGRAGGGDVIVGGTE